MQRIFSLCLPPNSRQRRLMFSGLPLGRPCTVRPLTPIPCDAVSLYLLHRFQWNLTQVMIMWVAVVEKLSKVRGHRSRLQREQMHFYGIDAGLW